MDETDSDFAKRSQLSLLAVLLAVAAAATSTPSGCQLQISASPFASAFAEPPRLLTLTSSAAESASAATASTLAARGGLLAYRCLGLAERRYSVCLPDGSWRPPVECWESSAPSTVDLPADTCRVPGLPSLDNAAEPLPVWSNLTATVGQSVFVECWKTGDSAVLLLGPHQWTCLSGAQSDTGLGRWDRDSLPRCVRPSVRCVRPPEATAERCLNPACDFYFAGSLAVFSCDGRETAHLCQHNGTWYPGPETLCDPSSSSVGLSGSPALLTTLAWVLAPCAVLALLLLAVALALLALRRARFLRRRRARRNAAAAAIVAAAGGSSATSLSPPSVPPLTPSAGSRDAGFDDFDYFSYLGGGGSGSYYYDDFGAIDLLLDSSASGRRSFPRSTSAAYEDFNDEDGVGGGIIGGGDLVRLLSAARPPSYEEAVASAADNPAATAASGRRLPTALPAAASTSAASRSAAANQASLSSRSSSAATRQSRRRPRPMQSPGPLPAGYCDGDTLSTSTAVSLPAPPTVSIAAGGSSAHQQQQQQQQQSNYRSSLETMAFSDGTSVTLPTLESASSRSLTSNRPLCGSVGKPADCPDGAT